MQIRKATNFAFGILVATQAVNIETECLDSLVSAWRYIHEEKAPVIIAERSIYGPPVESVGINIGETWNEVCNTDPIRVRNNG